MSLRTSIFLGIVLFLGFSCKETSNTTPFDFKTEIASLRDTESKKKYLELIFEDDQKMRREGQSTQIMIKQGSKSEEYLNFIKEMNDLDALNLKKIEAYLESFGHPKKQEFGEIATLAPWAVIHHSTTYEDRFRNFKYLYNAYKNNDLTDRHFSMFLDRMYRIKQGSRIDMGSTYKEEDKINTIIEKLELKI